MATVSLLANGLGDVNRGGSLMPTGTVLAFAGSTAPSGWLLCDGTAYLQSDYPALYGVIASTYNTQTNPTTGASYTTSAGQFRVPDYRGCFLRSSGQASGQSAVTVGGYQGQATAVNNLGASQASHSHTVTAATSNSAIGLANNAGGGPIAGTSNDGKTTSSVAPLISLSSTDTETRPINKGVMYIIKV